MLNLLSRCTIFVSLFVMLLSSCSPPPPPPEIKKEFQVAEAGKYIIEEHKARNYGDTYDNVKKGLKFLEVGMLDEAESEFKTALEFNPKFVVAHINLGRTYLAKEMLHHAIEEFDIAIHLDPGIAKAHYYQAIAYEKMGQNEEAIRSLRNALELDSNLTDASDMLQRLLGVSVEERTPNLGNLYIVSVNSQPSGASVMLNREFKGNTPLTLKMDLATMNQLKVSKEEYVVDHQDLKFNDDKTVEMTVYLIRSGQERSKTVMSDAGGLRLVIDPIHFDFNSAVVRSDSYGTLNKAGEALLNFPAYHVAVEGHTDDVGTNDYNQRLSEERAQAVAEYLARNFGIEGSRFHVKGYGEGYPVADNKSETGRALNRRTEIIILTNGASSGRY